MCYGECGRQLILKERKAEWSHVQLGLECEFVLERVVANVYGQVQQQKRIHLVQPAVELASWVLKDKGGGTVASWFLCAYAWYPLPGPHSWPGQLLLILQVWCHMLHVPEATPDFSADKALARGPSFLCSPSTDQQHCNCLFNCVPC